MLAIAAVAAATSIATAQDNNPKDRTSPPRATSGETSLPAHQQNRQEQPQGPTGPLDTTTGGAPAASPQGQTPPGMQSAPEGSSKSIVDEKR